MISKVRVRVGTQNYDSFIYQKLRTHTSTGISRAVLSGGLYPHQRALANWALRRARAAIFAGTGLGKSRIEIAWGNAVSTYTNRPVLMLTPIAVGPQMVIEAEAMGIVINLCRDGADTRPGINVTNYERLHRFSASDFAGVIADESGCIKHYDSKTAQSIIDTFRATEFRLFASATPAPNDYSEYGMHAEALGVCTRSEMLSEFFVHDGGDTGSWRLKKHAASAYWKWVAAWGALIRSPTDLGFDGSAYVLPSLNIIDHTVGVDIKPTTGFFPSAAKSLTERRAARISTLDERVASVSRQVQSESQESWVVWCELNAESDLLVRSIPGAIEVRGSMEIDDKEKRIMSFARGETRVLVTKPSICGWGANWQHCARQAFAGINDSYESEFQAIRRSWRFGQRRAVDVHRYYSAAESEVILNLRRKHKDNEFASEALAREAKASVMGVVTGAENQTNSHVASNAVHVPSFL